METEHALEYLSRVAAPNIKVEVIFTQGRNPSLQRNVAASEAAGEILYFLDDDSDVTSEVIQRGLSKMTGDVVALGGPASTRGGAGIVERAIGSAMGTRLGGGFTRSRHEPTGGFRVADPEELTLCNFLIRRALFLQTSGFKEGLHPGEDPEYFRRLWKEGVELYYDPDFMITRSRRKGVRELAMQFFRYGRGRARHVLRSPRIKDLVFFAPTILILFLVSAVIFNHLILGWGIFLYLLALLLECVSRAIGSRSALPLLGVLLIPIIHVSYGVGFLFGLTGLVALDTQSKDPPLIRKVS